MSRYAPREEAAEARPIWTVVLGVTLLTACAAPEQRLPGEGRTGAPCDRIIPDCEAHRLENVVLRSGASDGALFSVDGLDTSGVLTFDEALAAAWRNDYRGASETVQVILGAADAWGSGTSLYYAVQWGGVRPVAFGPGSSGTPSDEECTGVWGTVIDAIRASSSSAG